MNISPPATIKMFKNVSVEDVRVEGDPTVLHLSTEVPTWL